jgi:hypothetical protein
MKAPGLLKFGGLATAMFVFRNKINSQLAFVAEQIN